MISFSDFKIKATIYSLSDKRIFTIKNPKSFERGFKVNNNILAMLEHKENKDYISIYDLHQYKIINHFFIDTIGNSLFPVYNFRCF